MRALLIDPHKREIREVDGDFNGNFDHIRQMLGEGQLGDKRAPLCAGPRLASDVHTYVDDEGYYRPGQAWFLINGYPNPLPGYCLVIGSNGPDEADLPEFVTVERLATLIVWIDEPTAHAMAPPITVSTLGPDFKEREVISSTPIDFTDKRPL